MCSYCLQFTCPPGCPNYDPPSNGRCAECGEPIPIESRIVNLNSKKYHYDCIKEMLTSEILEAGGINTTDELLELLGADVEENPDPADEWV